MVRTSILLHIILFFTIGCESPPPAEHYFLDGYPELIFEHSDGYVVPTSFFINYVTENGSHLYQVNDTSLTLVYRRNKKPYTGYIRTYQWDIYNIEGTFKEGKIERLRFWHPNRTLGMDWNFLEGTGEVWNLDGARSISWNKDERILFNTATQRPREIHQDSISTYFNLSGELTSYTQRTDSMLYNYYPNGDPRYFAPLGYARTGEVKRWHPNGQLRAIGEYLNGRQSGTWIEYDSLGNEINRQHF